MSGDNYQADEEAANLRRASQAMTQPRDQQSEKPFNISAAAEWYPLVEKHIANPKHLATVIACKCREYKALTAHDEARPGTGLWTYEPHPELAFFCINDGNDCLVANVHSEEEAALIVAAHNSALRLLVDALRKIQYRIDEQLVGIEDEQVLVWIRDDTSKALQPYSTQKLSAQSRATKQKEKHASD